jgi:hypothetical protein
MKNLENTEPLSALVEAASNLWNSGFFNKSFTLAVWSSIAACA